MLRDPRLVAEAKVNGTDTKMEVDTGASRNINMETYNAIKRNSDSLTHTNSNLRTYSGDFIKPKGMTEASFRYENQCLVMSFFVANIKRPNLLERDILRLLRLIWKNC